MWNRYRQSKAARRALVVLLIAVSPIPFIILLPVLGGINIAFLVLVWVLFLWMTQALPRRVRLFAAVLAAIALAIPPYPNYLSITAERRLHFSFIGFENVFDHPFGLSFLFAFYLAIFAVAVFLLERKQAT